MMVYRPEDFLYRVMSSGLVTPAQLEAVRRRVARLCTDLPPTRRVWAEMFVHLGILTRAQVEQLMSRPAPEPALEGYEIIEEVGRGGLGRVLRAKGRCGHEEVALKVFQTEGSRPVPLLNRCQERLERARELDHPHLVHVREAAWTRAGQPVVVRDFVAGTDARTLTRQNGRLPAGEVVRIAGQLCDALDHTHRQGLAHRNIKPANILITRDGSSHLADFGVVSLTPADEVCVLNPFENLWDYVPPEQVSNPAYVDPRSDLYSLGCTLYHLLAGHPPFAQPGVTAKLQAHRTQRPTDLRRWAPDVPETLDRLVLKLLAKRPQDRFPSAQATAEALRDVNVRRPDRVSPAFDLVRWQRARQRAARRQRQRRWRWLRGAAVTAAAAALALAAAIWFWPVPSVRSSPPAVQLGPTSGDSTVPGGPAVNPSSARSTSSLQPATPPGAR